MAPKKTLTLNEQLALLDDPAPRDFDPEGLDDEFSADGEEAPSDDGSGSEDEDDDEGVDRAREHYVAVGKSALRKKGALALAPLGKKYEGARVSRDKLYDSDEEEEDEDEEDDEDDSGEEGVAIEDVMEGDINFGVGSDDDEIDSDDALGSDGGDEGRFAGWKFSGSATTKGGKVPKRGDQVAGSDSEEEESGDEEEESGEEGESTGDDEESDNESQSGDEEDGSEEEDEDEDEEEEEKRQALSKMMADEKKAISENITKAAQSDAEKGIAVRQQQKTFDSFLGARIKLQKALTAVNSLPPTNLQAALPATPEAQETWKAAEASAIKLWNTLHSLRVDITSSRTPNLKKRKADEIDEDTPIAEIWKKMARLETEVTPWREGVLEKWSNKTQTVSTVGVGKKLNNATPRSLTASIRESLSTDHERLISRTRTPRSCAPIQAANDDIEQDPEIFDDTDLYQQLLKALVDQRMVDSSAGGALQWTAAMRDAKKKKKVDTKASKGRKLRYHVHEKLQNFMAPDPNNGWQETQITELFSSLLGQRVRVDEDEDEDEDMEDVVPDDGLRLFR